ncbi:MAG: hypothetical protein M1470_11620 [Bacteroidetes bacterium]|nr:hypothetical protein [Bacteroidota bacterium]MCL5737639.1 hypothetical protein [Bacteroidota bacterium]
MELEQLIRIVGDEPVFETGFLLAGDVDPQDVLLQLSRWTKAGRLYQIRRGIYSLAPPYQKVKPHPFLIANRMVRASYVSCQSALEFHALIPEHTPVIVSVTTSRPGRWETPLGAFEFRHIKKELLSGYQMSDLGGGQKAFVATPEKALLDLVYLQPAGDTESYLNELRLKNLERLDLNRLQQLAAKSGSPKLLRAAARIAATAGREVEEYRTL